MTVRVTTIQRLVGTAAQRGAMTDAERNALNPGSTYFETDTGLLYVLDAATPHAWQLKRNTTQLSGDTMTLYGDGLGDRPAADAVEIGTVFVDVNGGDLELSMSDGAAWQDL